MTREEAIRSLELSLGTYEALEIGEEEFKMAIKALKEQRPHGEWIPCSERLPEEGTRILFCDIDGDVYCGKKYYGGAWWDDRNDDHVKNVIAWMPLPKPYKEEGDEK